MNNTPSDDQLACIDRDMALAAPEERLQTFIDCADTYGKLVRKGYFNAAALEHKLCDVARAYDLSGEPGSSEERIASVIGDKVPRSNGHDDEPPPVKSFDEFGGRTIGETESAEKPAPRSINTITPASWKGTEPIEQRWLARGRIPSGDLTILAGNGASGKTEIATSLLVSVSANLGDWLGCIVESGPVLFLSCEEPEDNIRDRVERICKHRNIDPSAIDNLHLHFPDLESTWLVTTDRAAKVTKTALFAQMENWIAANEPALVVIDSIAAVFDGEAIARRQVRSFLAMLRKVAREYDTVIVLLDHPSVRGMADGTGTANSVDWRNSARSMLHLSDPDKDDRDVRTLEVKKANYSRTGEKTKLSWNGLTFATAAASQAAPYRAAAEQGLDDLFVRLLEERNTQGRWVTPNKAAGYAPKEFATMPGAGDCTPAALANAMERLLTAKRIIVETFGPPSKQRQRLIINQAPFHPREGERP
jgi:RecA-family ATPase